MQKLCNSSLCDPNTLAGPSTPTRTSCGGNCCARCRGCFDHFISRHLHLSQGAAPSQEPSDVKVLEVPSRDISLQNFTQWQTDVIVSPGPSLFAAPQFAGADIFS